jgi:hypothetical protein
MRVEDRAVAAMIMFVMLIAEIFMFEKYLLSKQRRVNVHKAFPTMAITLTIPLRVTVMAPFSVCSVKERQGQYNAYKNV